MCYTLAIAATSVVIVFSLCWRSTSQPGANHKLPEDLAIFERLDGWLNFGYI